METRSASIGPIHAFGGIDLKDGDAVTGSVINGELVFSVHSNEEILSLEKSLDTSRAEAPIPLEDDFFERLRSKVTRDR